MNEHTVTLAACGLWSEEAGKKGATKDVCSRCKAEIARSPSTDAKKYQLICSNCLPKVKEEHPDMIFGGVAGNPPLSGDMQLLRLNGAISTISRLFATLGLQEYEGIATLKTMLRLVDITNSDVSMIEGAIMLQKILTEELESARVKEGTYNSSIN